MGLPQALVGARGEGPYLWDLDGRRYIDYLQSYGAGILGHGRREVTEAVRRAAAAGPLWGLPCREEAELAEALREAIPSLQRLRFVSSGTEAMMSAVRLARAATGRDLLVKFDAGYHGHADPFLGQTGSAAAHAADAEESAGVPEAVRRRTVTLPWGDAAAVRRFMARRGRAVAAVCVEPVAANIGLVVPPPGFLATLRQECDRTGALLICDEVITAFRFRYGSMAEAAGIRPDLIALGKLIGGGLPIGAYGGRKDLMTLLSPEGSVFQAGTYAGHPVSMAAGLATLAILRQEDPYARLEALGAQLESLLRQLTGARHLPVILHRLGGALSLWFGQGEVRSPADVERTDLGRFAAFFQALLRCGVLTPPSPYEVWFLSLAHGPAQLEETAERVSAALDLAL
jgi:glutamate-1-semialdehyde 2,1-aminomutase